MRAGNVHFIGGPHDGIISDLYTPDTKPSSELYMPLHPNMQATIESVAKMLTYLPGKPPKHLSYLFVRTDENGEHWYKFNP